MINFGIDLGTTNSLIAKFDKGIVEVFNNPIGFKEILPSVVGFRNDRILVGDQAITYREKDPKSVKGLFKRKMGTTECFTIQSTGLSKTPIELSAFVLKALKLFIHSGEVPEAVVITIPASFDMVQSHATTEAGYAAGFKQVVLLQEPIAASLAYANKEKNIDLRNSQWIVYDLGGGTFDVALVKIVEGELKIIDHEGDNFLGGTDFDALIVENIIVPQLEKLGEFQDLLSEMKSDSGKYNRLWYRLLSLSESAKIELSARTSAEIEFSVDDDEGDTVDAFINVTRSEFEALIKQSVEKTADMMKKILTRNSLQPNDLQFVLMVGGSTYIPFVRKRIEELLGITVNTGINPTNAITIGAAYYAATKEIDLDVKSSEKSDNPRQLKIKFAYNRTSQEREEMFSARVEGCIDRLYYRIIRDDGGYDSGLKQLTPRLMEDLLLQVDAYNFFSFNVYDEHNNLLPAEVESIQIAQGKYSVVGQPLPFDLSLVKDDLNTINSKLGTYDTKLDCLFTRNSLLPGKAKRTVEVLKTIAHNSEEKFRIIVVEGDSQNHSATNKEVAYFEISGKKLERDLLRGTEIDLAFEVTENRDIKVQVYINPSGPEFSEICRCEEQHVSVDVLSEEAQRLDARLEDEIAEASATENYEVVKQLKKLSSSVEELCGATMLLTLDDVTDDRYKSAEEKRRLYQEFFRLTSNKRVEGLLSEYHKVKAEVKETVNQSGNDSERRQFLEFEAQESTILNSKNQLKITAAIDTLHHLSFQILQRTPEFLLEWFAYLSGKRETFNDQLQAKALIEAGKKHIADEDYDRLLEVNFRLGTLLPEKDMGSEKMQYFTRIG